MHLSVQNRLGQIGESGDEPQSSWPANPAFETETPRQCRVESIGGYYEVGIYCPVTVAISIDHAGDAALLLNWLLRPDPLIDLNTTLSGEIEQLSVENRPLDADCPVAVRTISGEIEGKFDASGHNSHGRQISMLDGGDSIERPEVSKRVDNTGAAVLGTGFLAGEACFIKQHDVKAGTSQMRGRRGTGRTTTDYDDVSPRGHYHGRTPIVIAVR